MHLRVNCPNGCVFRAPASRAGQVVRCPKCKTPIRVGRLADKRDDAQQLARLSTSSSGQQEDWSDFHIETGEPVDSDSSKIAIVSATEIDPIEIDDRVQSDPIAGRALRSRSDRILLSRITALFILVVGLVNLAPAAYQWFLWAQDPIATDLPRWIYLLIFLAAVHVLYALFVFQVPDWSALRAVSVVMLIVAAICGFISVGIVLGGANSPTAAFLGLPFSLLNSATIWCVAMLLLAIITSYMTARESFNWQRIDQILNSVSEVD